MNASDTWDHSPTSTPTPTSAMGIRVHLTPRRLPVDLLTVRELLAWLEATARSGDRAIVLASNLHALKLLLDDEEFAACHRAADLVVCDGFPIHRAARRRYRLRTGRAAPASERIGSTDWVPSLDACPSIRRVLLVGGRANAEATAILGRQWPRADVRGVEGTAWDADCEEALIREVRAFRPQLVLVGLGTPLQERVIARVAHELPPCIWAGVGGAIDQLAGLQRNAPRWMGPLGLEWLFRLATQPTRLAHRYLVEPWVLLAALSRLRATRAGGEPHRV